MVDEVVEAEAKPIAGSVGVAAEDVAKGFKIFRLPVRDKSHHFVLVAKFRKAKILGNRAVVEPQRVRERDSIVNLHAIARTSAPHGAREIPQAVRRQQGRALEWRNEESARQMRLMVFDAMECCG